MEIVESSKTVNGFHDMFRIVQYRNLYVTLILFSFQQNQEKIPHFMTLTYILYVSDSNLR